MERLIQLALLALLVTGCRTSMPEGDPRDGDSGFEPMLPIGQSISAELNAPRSINLARQSAPAPSPALVSQPTSPSRDSAVAIASQPAALEPATGFYDKLDLAWQNQRVMYLPPGEPVRWHLDLEVGQGRLESE